MHVVPTENIHRRLEPLHLVYVGENPTLARGWACTLEEGHCRAWVEWTSTASPGPFWTVHHFSDGGLGPLKTCTHPVGTSTVDLRSTQNLCTHVSNVPLERKWLEPKWLEPEWLRVVGLHRRRSAGTRREWRPGLDGAA